MTPAEKLAKTEKVLALTKSTPLLEIRNSLGLRAQTVYEALGISPNTLASYERGRYYPPLSIACKIMKFYGKTIEELWPELLETK